MGFPSEYVELLFPKLLLYTLSLLTLTRKLIKLLLKSIGLTDFLELETNCCLEPVSQSVSEVLIKELIPVLKFSELNNPPANCAVCLYDFLGEDEVKKLPNCTHIFHRGCVDRWMGCQQRTCPLCRAEFLPDELRESINERLWVDTGILESYGEYSIFSSGL